MTDLPCEPRRLARCVHILDGGGQLTRAMDRKRDPRRAFARWFQARFEHVRDDDEWSCPAALLDSSHPREVARSSHHVKMRWRGSLGSRVDCAVCVRFGPERGPIERPSRPVPENSRKKIATGPNVPIGSAAMPTPMCDSAGNSWRIAIPGARIATHPIAAKTQENRKARAVHDMRGIDVLSLRSRPRPGPVALTANPRPIATFFPSRIEPDSPWADYADCNERMPKWPARQSLIRQ